MIMFVCVFVEFIGRFVRLCRVVSSHVMKFNFDKYSYESAIGLDALPPYWMHALASKRVYSYL